MKRQLLPRAFALALLSASLLFSAGSIAGAQVVYAPAPAAHGPYGHGYAAPYSAPYAGPYNHAHAVAPFRYGWFGAERFSDPAKWHRGYYGNHYRWRRK